MLFFCTHFTSLAQKTEFTISKLTTESGLPSDVIFCTYQDSKGFIWIGTKAGLVRYDGIQLVVFDIFNTPLLSNNKIHAIVEDDLGYMWVGTELGLTVLDTHGLVQKVYWVDPDDENSISDNRIRYLYKSKDGAVWIGTDNGTIDRYQGNDQFETVYEFKNESESNIYGTGITANFISYIAEDQYGHIWVRDYWSDVAVLKPSERGMGKKGEPILEWTSTPAQRLKAIGLDYNQEIWGLNEDGLLHYNRANDRLELEVEITLKDSVESAILIPNKRGKFWLVDNLVCAEIDPQNGNLNSLYDPFVGAFKYSRAKGVEDLTGTVWMTSDEGVISISPRVKYPFLYPLGDSHDLLTPPSIYGLLESHNGDILISSTEHLLKMEPTSQAIDTILTLKGKCFQMIESNQVLWLLNEVEGLYKIDIKSGTSKQYKLGFKTRYHSLLQMDDGNIWVGTGTGIFALNPDTGLFTRQFADQRILKITRIYKLLASKDKTIWAVSSKGLWKIDAGRKQFNHYNPQDHHNIGLRSNVLVNIHETSDGKLWLASNSGGFIRFDPVAERFKHYTKLNGLTSNSVKSIIDADDKLWVSTANGLSCFDPVKETFKNYYVRDGLSSNIFHVNSALKSASGQLYFGGPEGINAFYPDQLENPDVSGDNYSVPIILRSFTKFDEKQNQTFELANGILSDQPIELNYYDRNFNFQFALADFSYSQENKFEYMIEGLDKRWVELNNQTSIYLSSLPFGSYTLRIKGKNANGIWSDQVLSIPLHMNRVYYKTPAFIILVIFMILIVLYVFIRWRFRRLEAAKLKLEHTVTERTREVLDQKNKIESDKNTIQKQAEQLKEYNAVQTRWFTNIAHELRTPLTLILGPIRQFLKQDSNHSNAGIENIVLAEKNSVSLLRLVNEILDVSKLESSQLKLNKENTCLTKLVKAAISPFDSMARQKGVKLSLNIQDDIEMVIDRDRIQNVLINLISNALKFTHKGGEVVVSVIHNTSNGVSISVRDTGDGISEKDVPFVFDRYYQAENPNKMNQGGTGIGLALCQELADLHGGSMKVESELGNGSVFTLNLPNALVLHAEKKLVSETNLPAPNTTMAIDTSKIESAPDETRPVILLVEDNVDMRQYIMSFMSANYQIIEAGDGVEALDTLKDIQPDLIISDVMMPRMDGVQLAKEIKANEELCQIPFLSLTAKATESDKLATLRIGIDDYLTKPFNAEELLVRSTNLINNYKARQASSENETEDNPLPSYQDKFIENMKVVVMDQLNNQSFSMEDLASSQSMSVSTLKRALKKATGMSPGKFIREIRLQEALTLLETKQYPTVMEVAYAVGYENASHFTKLYQERFGKKPSEYL